MCVAAPQPVLRIFEDIDLLGRPGLEVNGQGSDVEDDAVGLLSTTSSSRPHSPYLRKPNEMPLYENIKDPTNNMHDVSIHGDSVEQ